MEFDLERALAGWRRQLYRHPGLTPGDVAELEAHLRDAIDDLRQEGLGPRTAFDRAVARGVGDPAALADEYALAHAPDRGLYGEASSMLTALLPGYARVALRHLARNKAYSAINIAGLALGIACSFLILLYVADEYGYDRFHTQADRIYRVTTELRRAQGATHVSRSPAPAIPLLEDEFPQVLKTVRFIDIGRRLVRYEDAAFYAEDAQVVDSSFFDVFDFPLLEGDAGSVLRNPLGVVITEGLARKLYGSADALGKTLSLTATGSTPKDFQIDGVAADPPHNSHIKFDLLVPFRYFEVLDGDRGGFDTYVMNWQNERVVSYALLAPDASAATLEGALPAFVARHRGEDEAARQVLHLEPMTDIYLHSPLQNELSDADGDIRYVYLLLSIAALILLIAGINFMNLTTARSAVRAREIGMRKVLGARRGQLVWQFLGESVLMALCALVLALLGIWAVLPGFNGLVGKELGIGLLAEARVWASLLGLAVGVGLASGLYPALYLSGFQPLGVLKGRLRAGTGVAVWLRKGLVVSQFAASSFLFVGTLVVFSQLRFLQHQKLGYDREQVALITIADAEMRANAGAMKRGLLEVPGVRAVSVVLSAPGLSTGEQMSTTQFYPAGKTGEEDRYWMDYLPVDHDFLDVMGIEMAQGRFFSEDYPTDFSDAFVINETAAALLGWDDPVGRRLDWYMPGGDGFALQQSGTVVGVVRDFHLYSLHAPIRPTVMMLPVLPWFKQQYAVKLEAASVQTALEGLEARWGAWTHEVPFEYTFLDRRYAALYAGEARTGRVFGVFAGLALLVACLGLFGLSAFMVEQRTKEIGIRKVLGASTAGLWRVLTGDFLRPVLFGFLLAVPFAYVFMGRWLQHFAYRASISPLLFVAVGAATLLLAVAVVSYRVLRAARANPARSLRYE